MADLLLSFEKEPIFPNNFENQNMGSVIGSEPLIGLPIESEESFASMYERENRHLPRHGYLSRLKSGALDLGLRREALDWIFKVHSHYSFGPLSFCLSINYLDRFLSVFELPRGETWAVQLLAVACLSLAIKMVETTVTLTVTLQVCEPKFVFEGRSIQRMELLVLSTLNWQIQALTPFSFIDYFLRKINDDAQLPSMALVSGPIQLILSTIKGIEFLEFRPSEIAAAVAVSVSMGATLDTDKALSSFNYLEKERVVKCLQLIKDLKLDAGGATSSFPQTPPSGVLDATVSCLTNNKSSDHQSSPHAKRIKLGTSSSLSSSQEDDD